MRPLVCVYIFYSIQMCIRDSLRGLLYFTDGMGTYPARRPAYDTAFLFLGDRFDDANVPPWAMKVVLDEEEFTGEAARSASALSEALAEEDDLYRDPVSYTHLDVYKRQGSNITCGAVFVFGRALCRGEPLSQSLSALPAPLIGEPLAGWVTLS